MAEVIDSRRIFVFVYVIPIFPGNTRALTINYKSFWQKALVMSK